MSAPATDWRYRLRGDPANWLLDHDDNPSVYFWFQHDIVGRPENSPALEQAREQILYSPPVQALYAAQDAAGYWESATSLDLPRYRATMWSLALLAEFGVPRHSRRAHAACEFVIQNHLNADGAFMGLHSDAYAGLLARALVYFKGLDPRLAGALDRLAPQAAEGNIFALWALSDAQRLGAGHSPALGVGANRVLDTLASEYSTLGVFPPFDREDALLALRVLTQLGHANDARAASIVEKIWSRQGEGARWSLDKSYNGMLITETEDAGVPGKWATLNVLRVLTRTTIGKTGE